jgi:hypothetical protein
MKQNNMKILAQYITRFLGKIPYKQIFFLWLIFATGYALAQGTPAAEPQSDSDVIRAIVQILNLVFTLITFLLTPAIILAGWLLSPDWTMGDFFGLRPYFINVWVLVSNLVYIVFALMLLWMAVMQIFSGESNYAFKKKLPRFLVGIMIVPFTWLIVSWTLSFANQAVAAVLSIPAGAIGGVSGQVDASGDKGLFHKKTIPKKFVLDFWEDSPGAGSETTDCKWDGGNKCISPAEFIAYNEAGPFFIIMVYAYDIFKIQNTEQVNFESVCAGGADVKSCIKSIWQLLRKFWVALITTVFFGIILIALCWVLLARAFKLWIYVMFSPLFGLSYALSDEWLWKTLESEWWGEWVSLGKVGFVPFFQLAMVPVLVSGVLSFWLLFIGVMNNTFTTGSMAPTGGGGFCTKENFMVKYCIEGSGESYSSRLIIGSGGSPAGDYTITFEFGSMISDFVGNSAGKTAVGTAGGLAEVGTDIFAHIILSIIAIAVMWMGVKAAVSYDEVTRKAFAPFAKFGDSVGNFVQNIPSYLPTPHPAFAAFNPATYNALGSGITQMTTDKRNNNNQRTMADIMWTPGTKALESAAGNLDKAAEALERMQAGEKSSLRNLPAIEQTLDAASTQLSWNESKAFNALRAQLKNQNIEKMAEILNKEWAMGWITNTKTVRFLNAIRTPGGTSAPIGTSVGTLGRLTNTSGKISVLDAVGTSVLSIDTNNNNVTLWSDSIKSNINSALDDSWVLTSEKAKELFGDALTLTDAHREAIAAAAKPPTP